MGEASEAEAVTGGCLCGAVRYRARVFLDAAYYCHCRMCQRSGGGPADVAVFVEAGSLAFTAGGPTYYRSSPFGERGFCATCGSRLLWKHVGDGHPDWTNLSVGCLDAPERVRPCLHQCVESQLPWHRLDDELPRLTSEEIPELVQAWREDGT